MRRWILFVSICFVAIILGCLGGGSGGGSSSPDSTVTGAVLSGRVYFSDRSLYGSITIQVKDASGNVISSTRTDSNGNFAFTSLPSGVYDLSATLGDSEIIFESGVQITSTTEKVIPEKSLLALKSAVIDKIGSTSFRISFVSNQSCTSSVEYSTAVGSANIQNINTSYSTSHSSTISGLTSTTKYSITVKLRGQDGQVFIYPGFSVTTTGAAGPSNLSVSINSGAFETRLKSVQLSIQADNAAEMRISENEDFSSGSGWETYFTTRTLELSEGDGTKRVYLQFRDTSGNISSTISDSILLTTSNLGYLGIWIESGKPITNKSSVVLTILFPGATLMRLSSRTDFLSSYWEPYSEARKWTLSTGDGTKIVYVQFQGGGANPDQTFSASIVLDTTGPEVSMKINNGALKTNQQNVSLNFSTTNSPIDMQIRNDETFTASDTWIAYSNPYSWRITDTDEKKTVYARFRDSIGNLFGPISANITLDTIPPKNFSFTINDGATVTTSLAVTLKITAEDASRILVSNSDDFTGAVSEGYKTIKSWTLGGYGIQSVYMLFLDDASNTSAVYVQSISMSGTPPGNSIVKINSDDVSTESATAVVDLSSSDAVRFRISQNGNFSGVSDQDFISTLPNKTMRLSNFQLSPKAGQQSVYARFENASGIFAIASDGIQVIGPSSYTISTNDSQPLATFSVNLKPFAVNAVDMLITEDYTRISDLSLWQTMKTALSFNLTQVSGWHTIYAKYRNTGHVETEIVSINVQATALPPGSDSIIVNDGDAETLSATATVTLSSPEAVRFRLSLDGNFNSASDQNFIPNLSARVMKISNFTLSPKSGTQVVWGRFENASGVFSFANDSIRAVGPSSYTLTTNDTQPLGAYYVNLQPAAENATQMLITEDLGGLASPTLWQPFSYNTVFFLKQLSGQHTIYGKYRNQGRIETDVMTLKVQVAAIPAASATILINGGDLETARTNVSLNVNAPGQLQMWLSNDGNFANFTPETPPVQPNTRAWTLTSRAGVKTVYAKFLDATGTYTLASDTIVAAGPANASMTTSDVQPLNKTWVNLNLQAENAVDMIVSEDLSAMSGSTGWIGYQPSLQFALKSGGGTHVVYSKFRNSTTNWIETVPLSLVVELLQLPPSGNTMAVRKDALPTSDEVASITENDLPIYLHFKIVDSNTATVSWQIATSTAGIPTVFKSVTSPPVPIALTKTDFPASGTYNIWYKYSDGVGNTTTPEFKTISVRSVSASRPSYALINNGDSITNSATVSVSVSSPDAGSFRLSLVESFDSVPDRVYGAPFQADGSILVGNFRLQPTAGTQNVYVRFLSPGGAFTYANDSISLVGPSSYTLTTPEQMPLATYVVNLRPNALGASEMLITEDYGSLNTGPWLPFAFNTSFNLSQLTGAHTIFAKYRNSGQVESDIMTLGVSVALPSASVVINNGDATTLSATVSLSLYAADAVRMQITNTGNFTGIPYQPYSSSVPTYVMSPTAGTQEILVRFENSASATITASDSIQVVGPSNSAINTPDTQPLATYALNLRPFADQAVEMLLTEDYSLIGSSSLWQPFLYRTIFQLQSTEGSHTIYAKYRNAGKVETSLLSLDVAVTTPAPQPVASTTILINAGDAVTNRSNVDLTISAPGQSLMRLSNDGNFAGATDGSPVNQPWFITQQAGTKTVYGRFQNASGAYTYVNDTIYAQGPGNASISTRDTQPLNTNWVNLDIYAENAVDMIITESLASASGATGWFPYQTSMPFQLRDGGGTHNIYAKFRNAATNYIETQLLSLQVTVNGTPPSGNTASFRKTAAPTSDEVSTVPIASLPIFLHFSISDQNTATVSWQLASAGAPVPTVFHNESVPVAPVILGPGDFPGNGTFNLYYCFADGVGNKTPLQIVSIEILGPKIRISPASAGPFGSGQSQQFAATLENTTGTINWYLVPQTPSTTYGTIDSIGKYTAPNPVTIATQTKIHAEILGNPTVYDEVVINLQTQVEIYVAQSNYQITKGASQTILVTFRNSASGGAVLVYPTGQGVATISSSVAGTPSTDQIATVSYTAPATVPSPPTVTVTVTSTQDPTKSKDLLFTVIAGPWISVNPTSVNVKGRSGTTILTGQTSEDPTPVTWSTTDGGLNTPTTQTVVTPSPHSVTYFSPAVYPYAPNPVTVIASFTQGATVYTATVTLTIVPPVKVTVSPKTDSIALATSTGVIIQASVENATTTQVQWEYRNASSSMWTSAGTAAPNDTGLLNLSGNNAYYTPPASWPLAGGNFVQVRATSIDDPVASDVATITLLAPIEVILHEGFNETSPLVTESPGTTVTLEIGTRQFFAEIRNAKAGSNLTVNWFVEDIAGGNTTYGTIDSTGKYSAPDDLVQSFVTVKAVSNADASRFAKARVNLQNFWTPRSDNLKDVTNATDSIYSVLIDPTTASASNKRSYCGTNGHGIYNTTVYQYATGTDWEHISWSMSDLATPNIGGGGKYVANSLDMSLQHPNRIAVGTNDGLFFSTDSGATFNEIVVPSTRSGGGGNYHYSFTDVFSGVAIDPNNDTYMYAIGKNQGVIRCAWDGVGTYTYDGTLWDDQQPLTVVWFEDMPAWQEQTGTPATSISHAWQYPRATSISSNSIQFNCITVDPQNPNIVYAGYSHHLITRIPEDTFVNGYIKFNNARSSEWLSLATYSYYPTGEPPPAASFGVEPGLPAVYHPTYSFYKGSTQGLIYSDTGGLILSMTVDPNTPTTIWAGKNNGVFRTTDDGTTWTSLGTYANVRDILIDPINTINVFIGTEAGLYRSKDAGGNWKRIKTGLEGHTTINSLGLSPGGVGTRRLFSGTTGGLYIGITSLDLE